MKTTITRKHTRPFNDQTIPESNIDSFYFEAAEKRNLRKLKIIRWEKMVASRLRLRKRSRRSAPFQSFVDAFIFVIIMALLSRADADADSDAASDSASDNPASETYILTLVESHIENFMSAPIESIGRAQTFLRIGGFPALSDGSSLGRSLADPTIESKWSFMETPIRFYFGREDGGFLIYPRFDSKPTLSYSWREVGNPGYEIEPFVSEENQRHWTSCLDEKGNNVNCTLPEDTKYIRCIDGCKMQLCNVDDETKSYNETENHHLDEDVWCRDYSIETVKPGEKRGGFPRYFSCIDELGVPTQTLGKVLQNYTDGELGNCYYDDGTTLVNGTGDTVGVYRTRLYDPRYRGWYMSSKETQRPLWSNPYIFFSLGEIGITYTEPIYTRVEGTKKVFDGVLAVDYTLEQIDAFLYEQFSKSDFLVAVVEAREPHFVVAVSTGSRVTYSVYSDDTDKPCPTQVLGVDLCTPVRITIDDLGKLDQNPGDKILSRAFEEQALAGFPADLIAFKEVDGMATNASISQASVYEQELANLKWRIIVVVPMERTETDAVHFGTKAFDVILATSILGFIFCIMLGCLFFRYRKDRRIQSADYRFTCAFLFGNALMNLSSLANLGENTDKLCMLRSWAFDLAFVIALAPLYVKVWRMYRLLHAGRQFRRVVITNSRAILYTLPIIAIEVVILIVFTFVDPPKAVENLGEEDNVQFGQLQSITCQRKTVAFQTTQIVFDLILVFAGCFLAYKSRNIDPRFGEARQLGFVMYNTAFMGILLIIFAAFFTIEDATFRLVETIAVAWWTIVNSLMFVFPRMMGIRDRKRKDAGKSKELWDMKFVKEGSSEILVTADSKTSREVSLWGANWTSGRVSKWISNKFSSRSASPGNSLNRSTDITSTDETTRGDRKKNEEVSITQKEENKNQEVLLNEDNGLSPVVENSESYESGEILMTLPPPLLEGDRNDR